MLRPLAVKPHHPDPNGAVRFDLDKSLLQLEIALIRRKISADMASFTH